MLESYKPSVLSGLLKYHDIHLSKSLGQNFITDGNIVDKIAGLAGLSSADTVLEIGAGAGALTSALCRRAGRVVTVEIDGRLMPLLAETLEGAGNVEIINEDFLKLWDGGIAMGPEQPERFVPDAVVGNLPYSITSPVVFKLLSGGAMPKRMVFMIQREVAERIIAPAGIKAYGVISVLCRYYCRVELCMGVPKEAFMPRPKVDSAVIRMVPEPGRYKEPADVEVFRSVVKAGFGQRRKTLRNALTGLMGGFGVTGNAMDRIYKDAGVDPGRRAETLEVEEFIRLGDSLCEARARVG